MIQIRQDNCVGPSSAKLCNMRLEFGEQHCIVLRQLFAPELLGRILQQLKTARFYARSHLDHLGQEFASDLSIREDEMALHMVQFLLNNKKLFAAVETITGCPKIGSFAGRVYRSLPVPEHRLEWHDDTDSRERLVGISINLSSGPYSGGVFELREKQSRRVICQVGSSNPGDAHLFRISTLLEHRVTRVEGEVARTSAAGWFLSEPNLTTALKALARPQDTPEG